jgi:hypothetical protein
MLMSFPEDGVVDLFCACNDFMVSGDLAVFANDIDSEFLLFKY